MLAMVFPIKTKMKYFVEKNFSHKNDKSNLKHILRVKSKKNRSFFSSRFVYLFMCKEKREKER